jgi:hypothetical protein
MRSGDALERFENYLLRLQDNEGAAAAESATANARASD